MSFCDVRIEHVAAIWPHVRGFVKAALDREGSGRYEPQDVLHALAEGKAKLWVVWNSDEKTADAAVVTEIVDYPRARELRIQIVGGRNMNAWARPSLAVVEEYARAQGCRFMAGSLRRGWIRVGGEGWRETGSTFEKRL